MVALGQAANPIIDRDPISILLTPSVAGPVGTVKATRLPVVTIGGGAAAVRFNVVIPSTLSNGNQTITATYNGLTTQTGISITVQGDAP